ncbi:DUF6527 family protein [Nibrella saemangeumensis]|uniref:DUF6527 family protein n=1 Tax=Nibrella saemangeumensis TaxID=1084526 RepID=UPI003CD0C02E
MKFLWRFTQKIWERWFKQSAKLVYVDDLPEKLSKDGFYVIGDPKNPWLLAFICPCGCQEIIQLSLLTDYRPHWTFSVEKQQRVTIMPSVWRQVGCRSHFWIKSSKVTWV